MSSTITMNIARAFKPLLYPSRYKGAHGGRGSGKSHVFAELLVLACLQHKGHRVLCGREVQKSLKESAKRLVEDKIEALKLKVKECDVDIGDAEKRLKQATEVSLFCFPCV